MQTHIELTTINGDPILLPIDKTSFSIHKVNGSIMTVALIDGEAYYIKEDYDKIKRALINVHNYATK